MTRATVVCVHAHARLGVRTSITVNSCARPTNVVVPPPQLLNFDPNPMGRAVCLVRTDSGIPRASLEARVRRSQAFAARRIAGTSKLGAFVGKLCIAIPATPAVALVSGQVANQLDPKQITRPDMQCNRIQLTSLLRRKIREKLAECLDFTFTSKISFHSFYRLPKFAVATEPHLAKW